MADDELGDALRTAYGGIGLSPGQRQRLARKVRAGLHGNAKAASLGGFMENTFEISLKTLAAATAGVLIILGAVFGASFAPENAQKTARAGSYTKQPVTGPDGVVEIAFVPVTRGGR